MVAVVGRPFGHSRRLSFPSPSRRVRNRDGWRVEFKSGVWSSNLACGVQKMNSDLRDLVARLVDLSFRTLSYRTSGYCEIEGPA